MAERGSKRRRLLHEETGQEETEYQWFLDRIRGIDFVVLDILPFLLPDSAPLNRFWYFRKLHGRGGASASFYSPITTKQMLAFGRENEYQSLFSQMDTLLPLGVTVFMDIDDSETASTFQMPLTREGVAGGKSFMPCFIREVRRVKNTTLDFKPNFWLLWSILAIRWYIWKRSLVLFAKEGKSEVIPFLCFVQEYMKRHGILSYFERLHARQCVAPGRWDMVEEAIFQQLAVPDEIYRATKMEQSLSRPDRICPNLGADNAFFERELLSLPYDATPTDIGPGIQNAVDAGSWFLRIPSEELAGLGYIPPLPRCRS